jgi:hypothetical protein
MGRLLSRRSRSAKYHVMPKFVIINNKKFMLYHNDKSIIVMEYMLTDGG